MRGRAAIVVVRAAAEFDGDPGGGRADAEDRAWCGSSPSAATRVLLDVIDGNAELSRTGCEVIRTGPGSIGVLGGRRGNRCNSGAVAPL
ncbi:hypothetical protein [Nocardia lijiangensis]|uniref:hypothetical protein n=1 Tax=Nocardia lijiangensis TaxID=299618 RepID=UPI000AB0DAD2